MELIFDLGRLDRPRGHALVYFTDATDPDSIFATYVVVFPLPVNMSKYVPPFLASSLGGGSLDEISCFPMPPAPERVENYAQLKSLADLREDDLIFGGSFAPNDMALAMQMVSEISQQYSSMWTAYNKSSKMIDQETESSGLGVNEVMYGLLSERDRLSEMSKLVVKLRYAVHSADRDLSREIEEELHILSRFFPEHYKVSRLIEASVTPSDKGAQLAQLCLDRCYSLSEGDEAKVVLIDKEINSFDPPYQT